MITIVDYGAVHLWRKLGFETALVSTAEGIAQAKKIVLPGVGAFDHGMSTLTKMNLVDALRDKVLGEQIPTLGICLGMQMLGMGSEEGELEGIGLINGRCERFCLPPESGLKVPHMGWNIPTVLRETPLVAGLDADARYYFTHSYHFVCDDSQDVLATVNHGIDFTAMVQHDNIMGTQFHPEKSHRFGMAILRNFGNL